MFIGRRDFQVVSLCVPAIVLVSIFVYIFAITTIQISLTNSSGVGDPGRFIGLTNYICLFTQDKVFRQAMLHTVELTTAFIGATLPLGLGIAILLHHCSNKVNNVFRIIFLIPLSFSFVATSQMWIWMFSFREGAINTGLRLMNLGFLCQPWLASSSQSIFCIAVAYLWQFSGFATVVYYAGISSVPLEINDAAQIDGATTWQRYRYVIIPLQKPATITVSLILLMYSLRVFSLVWLMTRGGPGYASEILPTKMYRETFVRFHFGYGASVAIVIFGLSFLVIGVFSYLARRTQRKTR